MVVVVVVVVVGGGVAVVVLIGAVVVAMEIDTPCQTWMQGWRWKGGDGVQTDPATQDQAPHPAGDGCASTPAEALRLP